MKNRLAFIVVLALLGSSALFTHAVLSADEAAPAKTPPLTSNVLRPLAAANDALKAGKPDDAIVKLKEAQAAKGDKTPYDLYVINALLGSAYAKKNDYENAAPALEMASSSEYCPPAQAKAWQKAVMVIYYTEKDYAKTVELGQKVIAREPADEQTNSMMGDSYYHLGKYKEAGDFIQQVTDKQEKPEEKYLKFEYQVFTKANDNKGVDHVLDKLLTYYPSQDYWLLALTSLRGASITDAHQQHALFRLEYDIGVLKRPSEFADMAELALDQGYPGETVAVLTRAFQQNAFTEQRDKERYQHLLDGAKQRAMQDQASLPAGEVAAQKSPNGNALIQIGTAYMTYGQAAKAVTLLEQGIAKGMLKNPEEAQLLLGEAQLRAGETAAAKGTFEKAASSDSGNYARMAKLWTLHVASPGAHNAA